MKTVRMHIEENDPALQQTGRIDPARVAATTDEEIAEQQAADEAEAMQDAARYVCRVRQRLGLSQIEFAEHIDVSVQTIRDWEQGNNCPTGAAKTLLKVLDKVPEIALPVLHE